MGKKEKKKEDIGRKPNLKKPGTTFWVRISPHAEFSLDFPGSKKRQCACVGTRGAWLKFEVLKVKGKLWGMISTGKYGLSMDNWIQKIENRSCSLEFKWKPSNAGGWNKGLGKLNQSAK